MKRDLFELLLGIGVLALGLIIILFTFTQALAIAQNPGEFFQNQLSYSEQVVGPTATFDWSSNDLSVTFTDTSRPGDGPIVAWDWIFGDGQRSNAQNPQHTYPSSGGYEASLVVRDANGKESTAIANVTVSVGQTRGGRGLNNPFGAGDLGLNLNFGDFLLPVAIALLTFGLFLMLWVADWVSSYSTGMVGQVANYISLTPHIENFAKGVIDLRDVVYYLSVIFLGVFLTHRSLESLRWRS